MFLIFFNINEIFIAFIMKHLLNCMVLKIFTKQCIIIDYLYWGPNKINLLDKFKNLIFLLQYQSILKIYEFS